MEGQMAKRIKWLGGLVFFFSFLSPAFSQMMGLNDGYTRVYGIDSRSAAMGGAMVAVAEGIEAVAYNPAILALTRNTLTAQLQLFPSAKLMVNEVNCAPSGTGVVLGFTQKFLRDRLGVGFLFNLSAGGGSGGGGASLPLIGGGGGYSWPAFSTPSLPLGWGFGFKLHETLGVGIAPASDIWIRLSEINIPVTQLVPALVGISLGTPPTDINPNMGLGISTENVKFAFAIAFRPIKYLSLGYMTIPMSKTRVRIPLVIRGGGLMDDIRTLIISDVSTTPPVEQFGAGIHIPIPHSKLTLAYTYQYLGFAELYEELLGDYLKYSDSLLNEVISVSYSAPSPKDDIHLNRYGLEYILRLGEFGVLGNRNPELAIRGGYFEWKSILPGGFWGSEFDNDFQVYSFGLGFKFDQKGKSSLERPLVKHQFAVDFHLQYLTMEEKSYITRYGYWQQPLNPADFYYYHTEGEIWAVGLEFTWLH